MTRELRIEQGPVVIVETDDDPGDMGEPRIITEDGATIVFVPSYRYWPSDLGSAGLREVLVDAASRAHRTGCRPLDKWWPFDRDFRNCRNRECIAAVAVLQ